MAIYATLTARDFVLTYFYPFWSIYLHFFPKTSSNFFPVLAVAKTGSCVGPQNKIGHPAGCGMQIGSKNMTCGMMTCEMNNLEIERSLFSQLTCSYTQYTSIVFVSVCDCFYLFMIIHSTVSSSFFTGYSTLVVVVVVETKTKIVTKITMKKIFTSLVIPEKQQDLPTSDLTAERAA